MNFRPLFAGAFALGAATLLAVAVPLAASAHVTITPFGAAAGSYALVTFKVPNESATASTNRLEIDLPTATPFTSVSYVPLAGWDAQLVTTTLPKPVKRDGNELTSAVTKVIWVAQPGFEIKAGQLQLFSLSLGSVPDTGKVLLPATQTYTDGTVALWNETGADAEHPAPVLYINDAPVVSHDADAEVTVAAGAVGHTTGGSPDILARILGIAGLVAGSIAITLAVISRRPKTPASPSEVEVRAL